ncbi:DUF423 domain-containing protein [Aliikangiella sp. IMCC44632]
MQNKLERSKLECSKHGHSKHECFQNSLRWAGVTGASLSLFAVVIGAFSAHALQAVLTERAISLIDTGAQYQMYHGIGLICIYLAARQMPRTIWLKLAAVSMSIGCVVFSGALYLIAFTGLKWIGAIAPVGGTALILAWLCFAIALFRD